MSTTQKSWNLSRIVRCVAFLIVDHHSSQMVFIIYKSPRMLWASDKRQPTSYEVLNVYVFDSNSCHKSAEVVRKHRVECGETVCVRCPKSHTEYVYPQRWSIIGWYQSILALLTQRNRATLMMMTQCLNISVFSSSYKFSPQCPRLTQTI